VPLDFTPSEEQRLLSESVARFFEREYSFEKRRTLLSSELGFGREIWARFAELGWLGIATPEAVGGLGGGAVELGIVMEGIGRHLALEPYFSSVVLGASLLRRAGPAQAAPLAELARGKLLLALAHVEPKARFELAQVETRAAREGEGFRLDGRKAVVLDAPSAHRLIVSARTAGASAEQDGISLFFLPASAKGVTLLPYRTSCGRRAAEVRLEGVMAGRETLLGPLDGGYALLARTAEEALAALAAEAVGAMAALLALTRDYLKTRKQFGVPIGSFQVLQHRLVDMFMALELARSTSAAAARILDDGAADHRYRARAAAAAKVQVGRAGRLLGEEAVQLHGGMGMTDELAVSHYFKRLATIDVLFGNADFHQRRFAALDSAAA